MARQTQQAQQAQQTDTTEHGPDCHPAKGPDGKFWASHPGETNPAGDQACSSTRDAAALNYLTRAL